MLQGRANGARVSTHHGSSLCLSVCYTCALIKHVAERCSVVVVVETPEMFSDCFNKVLCRKYARKM